MSSPTQDLWLNAPPGHRVILAYAGVPMAQVNSSGFFYGAGGGGGGGGSSPIITPDNSNILLGVDSGYEILMQTNMQTRAFVDDLGFHASRITSLSTDDLFLSAASGTVVTDASTVQFQTSPVTLNATGAMTVSVGSQGMVFTVDGVQVASLNASGLYGAVFSGDSPALRTDAISRYTAPQNQMISFPSGTAMSFNARDVTNAGAVGAASVTATGTVAGATVAASGSVTAATSVQTPSLTTASGDLLVGSASGVVNLPAATTVHGLGAAVINAAGNLQIGSDGTGSSQLQLRRGTTIFMQTSTTPNRMLMQTPLDMNANNLLGGGTAVFSGTVTAPTLNNPTGVSLQYNGATKLQTAAGGVVVAGDAAAGTVTTDVLQNSGGGLLTLAGGVFGPAVEIDGTTGEVTFLGDVFFDGSTNINTTIPADLTVDTLTATDHITATLIEAPSPDNALALDAVGTVSLRANTVTQLIVSTAGLTMQGAMLLDANSGDIANVVNADVQNLVVSNQVETPLVQSPAGGPIQIVSRADPLYLSVWDSDPAAGAVLITGVNTALPLATFATINGTVTFHGDTTAEGAVFTNSLRPRGCTQDGSYYYDCDPLVIGAPTTSGGYAGSNVAVNAFGLTMYAYDSATLEVAEGDLLVEADNLNVQVQTTADYRAQSHTFQNAAGSRILAQFSDAYGEIDFSGADVLIPPQLIAAPVNGIAIDVSGTPGLSVTTYAYGPDTITLDSVTGTTTFNGPVIFDNSVSLDLNLTLPANISAARITATVSVDTPVIDHAMGTALRYNGADRITTTSAGSTLAGVADITAIDHSSGTTLSYGGTTCLTTQVGGSVAISGTLNAPSINSGYIFGSSMLELDTAGSVRLEYLGSQRLRVDGVGSGLHAMADMDFGSSYNVANAVTVGGYYGAFSNTVTTPVLQSNGNLLVSAGSSSNTMYLMASNTVTIATGALTPVAIFDIANNLIDFGAAARLYAPVIDGGSGVALQYGGATKLATSNTGVSITGTAAVSTAVTTPIVNAASGVSLQYNGATKVATSTAGITVTGTVDTTTINNAAGVALQYGGATKFASTTSGGTLTGTLVVSTGVTTPVINAASGVTLQYNGAAAFATTSTGGTLTGTLVVSTGVTTPLINAVSGVTLQYNGADVFATTSAGGMLTGVLTVSTSVNAPIVNAVSGVSMQFNGATKIATTTGGVAVTGTLDTTTINNAAGVALQYGGSTKAQTTTTGFNVTGSNILDVRNIYDSTGAGFVFNVGGTSPLTLTASTASLSATLTTNTINSNLGLALQYSSVTKATIGSSGIGFAASSGIDFSTNAPTITWLSQQYTGTSTGACAQSITVTLFKLGNLVMLQVPDTSCTASSASQISWTMLSGAGSTRLPLLRAQLAVIVTVASTQSVGMWGLNAGGTLSLRTGSSAGTFTSGQAALSLGGVMVYQTA